jgi:hypothetical protein
MSKASFSPQTVRESTDHDELWHLFCFGCGYREGRLWRSRCGKIKDHWRIGSRKNVSGLCTVCTDLHRLPKCERCGYEPRITSGR